MELENKIKLIKLAYKNAKKHLKWVDNNKPIACGDMYQSINDAHEVIEDFGWLMDDDQDLPHLIYEFVDR